MPSGQTVDDEWDATQQIPPEVQAVFRANPALRTKAEFDRLPFIDQLDLARKILRALQRAMRRQGMSEREIRRRVDNPDTILALLYDLPKEE